MSTPSAARPARAYPLPRPDAATDGEDDDARFTHGLVLDVVDVLVAHGYPSPAGPDWGHLVHALHHTLYAPASNTDAVNALTETP